MKQSTNKILVGGGRGAVKRDILASMVVFLVALPLCIGIAVAVGVNPARALMTGIIGGLVVGFLAGSPLQVSGPAAGLFVIVADLLVRKQQEYLAAHGGADAAALESEAMQYALVMLGAAVFLAGAIQFAAGQLRLGQWFRAVSPAVIYGMLAGIGILIFASQFHVMLDHVPYYRGEKAAGGVEYLATIPDAIRKVFALDATHHLAAATGVLTILVIVLWERFAPQKLRLVPGPLLAILAATVFVAAVNLPVVMLKVPESLSSEITLLGGETFRAMLDPSILLAGLVFALVASAETLLCATAIDQMQDGPRTNYDRELAAQGVGNMLCGCLGALPMTGVIVRSSTNVRAGAQTRLSTILHGLWLLVFVVALPWVLALVPKASLGAILVYIGYKLVNVAAVKKLWRLDKSEVAIYVATTTIIVVEDLLLGVAAGIVLSALKLLYRFSYLAMDLDSRPEENEAVLQLRGSATFLRLPLLAAELARTPVGAELRVDCRQLDYIDHACLELLSNWGKQHEAAGGSLVVGWDELHARFKANGSWIAKQQAV
jgi:MFS superfamily sulfate permease-like transporter